MTDDTTHSTRLPKATRLSTDLQDCSKSAIASHENVDNAQASASSDESTLRDFQDEANSADTSSSSGSCSTWSDFSNDQLGDGDLDTQGCASHGLRSELSRQITGVIDQLNRLSTAIRRSGSVMRYEKADLSLAISGHLDFISSLHFYLAREVLSHNPHGMSLLRSKSFSGPRQSLKSISVEEALRFRQDLIGHTLRSVQDRLITANVKRRNRILYARRRAEKMVESLGMQSETSPSVKVSIPLALNRGPQIQQAILPQPNFGPEERRAQTKAPGAPGTATTATGVGSQLNASHLRSSVASGKLTRTGAATEFPRTPWRDRGTSIFQCPYCYDTMDRKYSERARWR